MSQALDPTNISTIIFDLGNVIIDIDYDVMVAEFRKIAKYDFREIISYSHQDSIFDLFEKGKISAADFRDALRPHLKDGVTDTEIDNAWNAILIGYPSTKFDLLRKLRPKYKLYALSNINELHAAAIDNYVHSAFSISGMKAFFDYAYYSHEMGSRKPEKEIYQTVLDDADINPAHTLFIDDKAENTAAAAALGFQVYHLTDRDSLLDVLGNF
jgi:FMN phosphatase YigB (HAD superfamily)